MPSDAEPARAWWDLPVLASVGAVLLGVLAMPPVLLPHAAGIHGVVFGAAMALGYGVGALVGWLFVAHRNRPGTHGTVSQRGIRSAPVLALILAGVLVGSLVIGGRWHNQLRATIGAEPAGLAHWVLVTAVVSALVASAFVGIARLVRRLSRWTIRLAARRGLAVGPARAAGVLAGTVGTLAGIAVVVGAVFGGANALYAALDQQTRDGDIVPDTGTVSGGQGSTVGWEDLGRDGRTFIAGLPNRADIADFTGAPAEDPVRVYVGLDASADAEVRAQRAVADLEALGGFDRSVLLVATSTGTGQLDPTAIEPLELMYGGDTAVVATQYSRLPSWLSFLADQSKARAAGSTLFDAVYARWLELPADEQPKLVAFGESLGAFGAEAAFSDLDDMATRASGTLLVGPPAAGEIHADLSEERDAGSPQWQPVYEQGREVRFGASPSDLDRPATPWGPPRLTYLQNASDPVVWWDWSLLWSRPDWLAEPPGPGVWPAMHWLPVLTFIQVTGDMMDSTSVPSGHGHVYRENQAGAWARILPPPGWTAADTASLVEHYG